MLFVLFILFLFLFLLFSGACILFGIWRLYFKLILTGINVVRSKKTAVLSCCIFYCFHLLLSLFGRWEDVGGCVCVCVCVCGVTPRVCTEETRYRYCKVD